METMMLTETPERVDFFQQCILNNLAYWHRQVTQPAPDGASADDERGNILRAISFGLDLGEIAWPVTFSLIEVYTSQMERRGYWNEWNRVLQRAIIIAQRLADTATEVTLSALFARLLFRQSRFKASVRYYRRTIRLTRQIGDEFNEARACSNLGYHYVEQGYWYRAEVLCCHALRLFKQIGSHHGQAHTENHLGALYTWQEKWDKAEHHLARACTLWKSMNDTPGLVYGLANFGLLYLEREMPDQALPYIRKALAHAEHSGDEISVGLQLMHLGSAYYLKSEWARAEEYLRQAEKIFSRLSHTFRLGQVYGHLGLTKTKQQAWDEASVFLYKALDARRKLGSKNHEARALTDLAEYELALGNQQEAKHFLEEAETLAQQHDQAKQYRSLWKRIDKLRRSLIEG